MSQIHIKFIKYRDKSNDHDDSVITVSTANPGIGAEDLVGLFKEFMLACGYQPDTVEEYLGAD